MKKVATLLLVTMMITLTACGSAGGAPSQSPSSGGATSSASTSSQQEGASSTQESPASSSDPQQEATSSAPEAAEGVAPEASEGGKTLIAYFSRADENIVVGVIETGNTQIIAEMIAEQTGGDLFHIQTVNPYPEDYEECTEVAQREKAENARPELTAAVEGMEDYNTVFLGYPNWWGDMPMAVYTFLESYDFSGKTIVPFCTHEGSGLSGTVQSIAAVCPNAQVLEGLSLRGQTAQNSRDEANEAVVNWLSGLELPETQAPAAPISGDAAQVSITTGDQVLYADLDGSELSREFAALLPQTISMSRVGGGREFYGSLAGSLNYEQADVQTTFENGDLAYWFSGNGLCLLYNNRVMGHVESGMELLTAMGDAFTVTMELVEDDSEEIPIVRPARTTEITMTVGDTVVTAALNDSETTREFLATLPRAISMTRYDDREYYGRIPELPEAGEAIPDFENGDVTYYPAGPSFAIFFAGEDRSNQGGLIRMGKITSELSVFDGLGESVEMRIEIAE